MSDFVLTPQLEELRREIARDFEEHPERWLPQPEPPERRSSVSLRRLIRLCEQHRGDEVVEELQRFVRLCRLERGEKVIPFPGRPSRHNPTPASPAAA